MRTIPERCQHLTGFLPRRVPTKTASGAWRVSPNGSKTILVNPLLPEADIFYLKLTSASVVMGRR